MAFSNGLSERMEELRYPNPRSPIDESTFAAFASPHRGQAAFFSPFGQGTTETRAGLPRRFTTDSSRLTTLSSLGGQGVQGGQQYAQAGQFSEAQLWEKKRQKIEAVREQKRKFEEQMRLLDMEERQLQQANGHDMDNLSKNFNRTSLGNAPVSEPTTPPEFADGAFPSSLSKPGRFSMGIMSPPGLPTASNRLSLSSTQIGSPSSNKPVGLPQAQAKNSNANRMSIKSMPGSRRGSDEEEDIYEEELLPVRTTSNNNRFSMPATGLRGTSNRLSTFSTGSAVNNFNGSNLYLDGEEEHSQKASNPVDLSSPDAKLYMQMTSSAVDDGFPTLRSDLTSGGLHANSAAIDLATAKDLDSEAWAPFTRHRPSHQSMPQNGLNMFSANSQVSSPPSEKTDYKDSGLDKKLQRHSMGVGFKGIFDQPTSSSQSMTSSRPQSLQSSYSTNDLPTIKTNNRLSANVTPPKTHAEQHFHNHNASLGRFPAGAVSNRQSRDVAAMVSPETKREEKQTPTLSNIQAGHPSSAAMNASALQANAPSFGPGVASATGVNGNTTNSTVGTYNQGNGVYGNTPYYQYAVQQYGGLPSNFNQMLPYNTGQTYNQYQGYVAGNRSLDVAKPGSARRHEENVRYNNAPLSNFVGDLYSVCKDQHGCRYLQRKLEEKNPENTQAIFVETCPHIAELMTDPFGNYLCQKLFEYCDRDQRTALIEAAAPSMVDIALNQHGTRALQKMIEYVETPEQVRTVISGLNKDVVRLVQDLNGNHVIQKCLNRLSNEDAQFIYDAAGDDCIQIGTHRHGCCVLQRCIDHANRKQRDGLIRRITEDAFDLVQDPFGNYVVQYILDLNEPAYTTPLCLSFIGNIAPLSRQKFSSNVVEKCLRNCEQDVKRQMIEEILRPAEMEKLLKDSYANYVVQTALDFSDPETKAKMIDVIRPILPAIKQTPHGRRIAGKIMSNEGGRLSGPSSGQVTPNEMSNPLFVQARTPSMASGRRQVQIYGNNIFQGANTNARYLSGSNGGNVDGGYGNIGIPDLNNGQWYANNAMNQPTQPTTSNTQQQPYAAYAGGQPGSGFF